MKLIIHNSRAERSEREEICNWFSVYFLYDTLKIIAICAPFGLWCVRFVRARAHFIIYYNASCLERLWPGLCVKHIKCATQLINNAKVECAHRGSNESAKRREQDRTLSPLSKEGRVGVQNWQTKQICHQESMFYVISAGVQWHWVRVLHCHIWISEIGPVTTIVFNFQQKKGERNTIFNCLFVFNLTGTLCRRRRYTKR